MALITFNDLVLSEALDRKAMGSVQGAAGDWALGALQHHGGAIPAPRAGQVFNLFQQITNDYTYVGEMVNQVTNVDITNSGANATNNAVVLSSLSSQGLATKT
jgi:hypothetical protein